ncbi:G0/G1 switch protein 2-like [Myripristis murdjan]|uniref:G0/G1 switch protein 2-like n=1 Tax=Myripristis murdjan TaxID=586833 RepID=UPI00117615F0|nr:G0/G1 switch protein 2-like [Myripristis murdjan]
MQNMQEFIPFAKEMLSQKPSRGLLKVYLVGSVFAVLGTVIGLVETVCQPFTSGEPLDAEMILLLAREQRTLEAEMGRRARRQEAEEEEEREEEQEVEVAADGAAATAVSKKHGLGQRNLANRLHAS